MFAFLYLLYWVCFKLHAHSTGEYALLLPHRHRTSIKTTIRSKTSFGISLALLAGFAHANDLEVITISAQQQNMSIDDFIATGTAISADTSDWLASVPGANANKNGPVSGIAQYRGMFGDRVSVHIDGHDVIGSGPNAMDAPLSYAPPMMLEKVSVYRGIAPVSAGHDTIGGAIDVELVQPEFGDASGIEISGSFQAGYRSVNEADSYAALVNIANKQHAFQAYYSLMDANNRESGDGRTIFPTLFEKDQFGLSYRVAHGDNSTTLGYHNVNTNPSGTPTLAMDIDYIDSDRFTLGGDLKFSDWEIDWSIGYLSSDHGMGNFIFRPIPNPAAFRRTTVSADTIDFKLHGETEIGGGTLLVGIDGYLAEHDGFLTNPNNPAFLINNFNDIEDNRIGLFAQWQQSINDTSYTVGAQLKSNRSDAGDISHFMAGILPPVTALVNRFNDADRSQSETNFDLAATVNHQLDNTTRVHASLGVKQRAPSYQERFLWFPLPITGGLGDGKTYVGNLDLDSETAYQFNAGFHFSNKKWLVSPNVFYQRIDDYIQGTPSTDPVVVMVATNVMGDESPLQFNNVEAEIYGLDVNWRYSLSSQLQLSGVASYIKGKRRDIDDNLYRIAPPNASVRLQYMGENWQGEIAVTGYAEQDDVSATNEETATPGYGVMDVSVSYHFPKATLQIGVNNLLDKNYAHHLSGLNRALGSDVAIGEKVLAEGRNLFATIQYNF